MNKRLIDNISFLLIALSIFSACFLPNGFLFTRLENLLIPLIGLAIILRKEIVLDIRYTAILVLFFLISSISIFINGLGLKYFLVSFRIIKYLLLFLLASNLMLDHTYQKKMVQLFKVVFSIIFVITMLQFFNPMGLGDVTFSFFTHHSSSKFFRHGSTRYIGTMMNPNDNGVVLLCFVSFFLSILHQHKRPLDLLWIILTIVLLVLAQSRTALLAMVAMIMGYVVLLSFNRKTLMFTLGAIALAVAGVFLLKMQYLQQLFEKKIWEIGEFKARYYDWNVLINLWKEHPILGVGYIKDFSIFRFAADSEYLFALAIGGILGFACYIGTLIYPALSMFVQRKKTAFSGIAVLLPIGFMLIAVTNFALLNVRIAILFFALMAFPFSNFIVNFPLSFIKSYRFLKNKKIEA